MYETELLQRKTLLKPVPDVLLVTTHYHTPILSTTCGTCHHTGHNPILHTYHRHPNFSQPITQRSPHPAHEESESYILARTLGLRDDALSRAPRAEPLGAGSEAIQQFG